MLIEINNSQSTHINRHAGLDKPAPGHDPGASRNFLKQLDFGPEQKSGTGWSLPRT